MVFETLLPFFHPFQRAVPMAICPSTSLFYPEGTALRKRWGQTSPGLSSTAMRTLPEQKRSRKRQLGNQALLVCFSCLPSSVPRRKKLSDYSASSVRTRRSLGKALPQILSKTPPMNLGHRIPNLPFVACQADPDNNVHRVPGGNEREQGGQQWNGIA